METYNNDYEKDTDFMMWELHEIRNKLGKKSMQQINQDAKIIIEKYKLNTPEVPD